ncbi:MAG: sialidase family protein [Bacteroidota bacterium]
MPAAWKPWIKMLKWMCCASLALGLAVSTTQAQEIDNSLGVDARVNYAELKTFGPWDDRNLQLTAEDLAILPADESRYLQPVPAFYRVAYRKATGHQGALPRVLWQTFKHEYGGYLYKGRLYTELERLPNGRFELVLEGGSTTPEAFQKQQAVTAFSEQRMTSPIGGSESTVTYNPLDPSKVLAGANGPSFGQEMFYSNDGGSTWTASAALPGGNTCCDPTIEFSSDAVYAYTATLGGCGFVCNIWVYRSDNGGLTWDGLNNETPGDPRRELTNAQISDKEFMHVDLSPTSPYKDNVYLGWHDNNSMKFSRSTDFANTWSANLTLSSGSAQEGIGNDITTDAAGNVYYIWPAPYGGVAQILLRKSTDGGQTFAAATQVAAINATGFFSIPSMETRQAWTYITTDVDRTGGTYDGSIYASWTDVTGPISFNPANNHAQIKVAYSRDGGVTWTESIPHPTADVNTVDRWNQWMRVGPDGTVYSIFYDTRNSVNRTGVDLYFSYSTDGAQTWTDPERVSSVTSPNLTDTFEFGDYNGLDILGNNLITVFTDNRKEGSETGNSQDIYSAKASIVVDAEVDVTAFLAGPYAGSSTMNTDLASGALIPLAQPYTAAPWNYSGGETLTSVPAGMVDWVLVQLLTGEPGAYTVAKTRAALLMSDGTIRDLDGTSLVSFVGTLANAYTVAVQHRNHFTTYSDAVALSPASAAAAPDLSTSQGTGRVEVEPGVFGLGGGDADANEAVDASDVTGQWLVQDGTTGAYLSGDFNLDGDVDAGDLLFIWLPSNGTVSSSP